MKSVYLDNHKGDSKIIDFDFRHFCNNVVYNIYIYYAFSLSPLIYSCRIRQVVLPLTDLRKQEKRPLTEPKMLSLKSLFLKCWFCP